MPRYSFEIACDYQNIRILYCNNCPHFFYFVYKALRVCIKEMTHLVSLPLKRIIVASPIGRIIVALSIRRMIVALSTDIPVSRRRLMLVSGCFPPYPTHVSLIHLSHLLPLCLTTTYLGGGWMG